MTLTVADLGEQGLLALLQSYGDPNLIGDDAALLDLCPGHSLVVTTDVLVEGVHFSDRTTPPHAVGWRAAAANLSDLAAMGASGLGITVALSLPSHCPVDWIQSVYQGIQDCLKPYNLTIVGGDVSRSVNRSLAITALGQILPEHRIQRHTARPDDVIVVTGCHGGAKAGLNLLMQPDQYPHIDSDTYNHLVSLHQYPHPRLDCVPILNRICQTMARSGRNISGMDSSDGLADAILQICRASGLGAVVDAEKISVVDALQDWPSAPQVLEWALYGGEDFELVLCMTAEQAQVFCQAVPTATVIGTITNTASAELVFPVKKGLSDPRQAGFPPHRIELNGRSRFQHFSRSDNTSRPS